MSGRCAGCARVWACASGVGASLRRVRAVCRGCAGGLRVQAVCGWRASGVQADCSLQAVSGRCAGGLQAVRRRCPGSVQAVRGRSLGGAFFFFLSFSRSLHAQLALQLLCLSVCIWCLRALRHSLGLRAAGVCFCAPVCLQARVHACAPVCLLVCPCVLVRACMLVFCVLACLCACACLCVPAGALQEAGGRVTNWATALPDAGEKKAHAR